MYIVKPIGPGETKELFESLSDRFLYTVKSEIHGACVRLLTDQERTKDVWENNFYNMSENVRSHCRLIVLDLPGDVGKHLPNDLLNDRQRLGDQLVPGNQVVRFYKPLDELLTVFTSVQSHTKNLSSQTPQKGHSPCGRK